MKPNELEAAQKRLQLHISLNRTVRCQTKEENDRRIAEIAGAELVLKSLPAAAKCGDDWTGYLQGTLNGLIYNIRIARDEAGKYDPFLASLCDQLVGAKEAINIVTNHIFQLRYYPEKFQNA